MHQRREHLIEDDLLSFAAALAEPGADLTRRLREDRGDHRELALRRALNAVAGRIASDLQEIAALTNASSGSIARNGFFLDRISNDASEQADLVDESALLLEKMVENMRELAGGARRSMDIATRTGDISSETADAVRGALADLAATATTVGRFENAIADLWVRVDGIESALGSIEDISFRSHLLSINANIEAAHAGVAGRTFAVIAREIGNLSRVTKQFTEEITDLLQAVRRHAEELREASREASQMTAQVRVSSEEVERALTGMHDAAELSREQLLDLEATASAQTANLDSVASDVRSVAGAAASTLRTVVQARNLQIGDLNSQVYGVIGRYRVGTFVDRSLELGEQAAREVEAILQNGLERGWYTLDDLLDPHYRELQGPDVKALGRLFDVSRAGRKFDPPKFGTAYDARIDESLCEIVDRYTEAGREFTAVCVLDNNAFHIAHARCLRAPITGDYRMRDRANNRVKRMFEGHTALRCARVGLPGAEDLSPRAARREYKRAGISLRRGPGERPYAVQSYARDTGEVFNDLSLALYVEGQHYGALSIAYPSHVV